MISADQAAILRILNNTSLTMLFEINKETLLLGINKKELVNIISNLINLNLIEVFFTGIPYKYRILGAGQRALIEFDADISLKESDVSDYDSLVISHENMMLEIVEPQAKTKLLSLLNECAELAASLPETKSEQVNGDDEIRFLEPNSDFYEDLFEAVNLAVAEAIRKSFKVI